MELKIDPEFEQKIPKLTEEEFAQLEENILSDGEIRDPLVVWNGTILDGHNRYRIYKRHPGLRFQTHEMELVDRNAAIIWICKNQLGRRNLTPEQKKYVIGKRYEAEKAAHGGSLFRERDVENGQFTSSPQNGDMRDSQKTSRRIAEETNTSKNYVQRAEQFAKGVDAADEVLPGIRDEILSGTIKPTEKAVSAVAKADPEERRELVEQLRQPWARPQEKEKTEAFTNTGKDENEEVIEWLDDGDPEEEVDFEEEDEEEESEQRYIPTRKEILAVSESMLHSEGVAAATEEDVMCEMKDALETLIWRWNNVGEVYAKVLRDKKTQKKIRELASEGMAFLREVRKGALWNEKG